MDPGSFFRQNGTAYFVMEYMEGESLSAYLDRCGGRLSYDETVRLLTPVLDALSDVHKPCCIVSNRVLRYLILSMEYGCLITHIRQIRV